MAINRFYNPSRGQYVSQFVPKELPTDLMLKPLLDKQKAQDKRQAEVALLGDYKQRAIGHHDKGVVDKEKEYLQSQVDYFADKDLTNPETFREYQQVVKKHKDHEGLKKVKASVDAYDTMTNRWKELKKKGKHADAESLKYQFERDVANYSREGGLGFEEGVLDKEKAFLIEGMDVNSELKKNFDDMKANGSVSDNFLKSDGITFTKSGWSGVSGKRINNRTQEVLEEQYNSKAGEQVQAEFDMQNGLWHRNGKVLDTNGNEVDRDKYETAKHNYFGARLQQVGNEFIHSNSSKTTRFTPASYQKAMGIGQQNIPNASLDVFKGSSTNNTLTQERLHNTRQTAKDSLGSSRAVVAKTLSNHINTISKNNPEMQKYTQELGDRWSRGELTARDKTFVENMVNNANLSPSDREAVENGLNSYNKHERQLKVTNKFYERAEAKSGYNLNNGLSKEATFAIGSRAGSGYDIKHKIPTSLISGMEQAIKNGQTLQEWQGNLSEEDKVTIANLPKEEASRVSGRYVTSKNAYESSLSESLEREFTEQYKNIAVVVADKGTPLRKDLDNLKEAMVENAMPVFDALGQRVKLPADGKFELNLIKGGVRPEQEYNYTYIDENGEKKTKQVHMEEGIDSNNLDAGMYASWRDADKLANVSPEKHKTQKAVAASHFGGKLSSGRAGIPNLNEQLWNGSPDAMDTNDSLELTIQGKTLFLHKVGTGQFQVRNSSNPNSELVDGLPEKGTIEGYKAAIGEYELNKIKASEDSRGRNSYNIQNQERINKSR